MKKCLALIALIALISNQQKVGAELLQSTNNTSSNSLQSDSTTTETADNINNNKQTANKSAQTDLAESKDIGRQLDIERLLLSANGDLPSLSESRQKLLDLEELLHNKSKLELATQNNRQRKQQQVRSRFKLRNNNNNNNATINLDNSSLDQKNTGNSGSIVNEPINYSQPYNFVTQEEDVNGVKARELAPTGRALSGFGSSQSQFIYPAGNSNLALVDNSLDIVRGAASTVPRAQRVSHLNVISNPNTSSNSNSNPNNINTNNNNNNNNANGNNGISVPDLPSIASLAADQQQPSSNSDWLEDHQQQQRSYATAFQQTPNNLGVVSSSTSVSNSGLSPGTGSIISGRQILNPPRTASNPFRFIESPSITSQAADYLPLDISPQYLDHHHHHHRHHQQQQHFDGGHQQNLSNGEHSAGSYSIPYHTSAATQATVPNLNTLDLAQLNELAQPQYNYNGYHNPTSYNQNHRSMLPSHHHHHHDHNSAHSGHNNYHSNRWSWPWFDVGSMTSSRVEPSSSTEPYSSNSNGNHNGNPISSYNPFGAATFKKHHYFVHEEQDHHDHHGHHNDHSKHKLHNKKQHHPSEQHDFDHSHELESHGKWEHGISLGEIACVAVAVVLGIIILGSPFFLLFLMLFNGGSLFGGTTQMGLLAPATQAGAAATPAAAAGKRRRRKKRSINLKDSNEAASKSKLPAQFGMEHIFGQVFEQLSPLISADKLMESFTRLELVRDDIERIVRKLSPGTILTSANSIDASKQHSNAAKVNDDIKHTQQPHQHVEMRKRRRKK